MKIVTNILRVITVTIILFPGFVAGEVRDLFEQDWYEVEIIVFKPKTPVFTNESLIHVAEQRILYRPLQTMEFTTEEFVRIYRDTERFVRNPESENSLFLKPLSGFVKNTNESVRDSSANVLGAAHQQNCWVHQLPNLNSLFPTEFESGKTRVRQNRPGDSQEERNSTQTRDARLPDWLPDTWQTIEWSVANLGNLLGLCDEDILFILGNTKLENLFESSTAMEENDSPDGTLTVTDIHESIREFEQELHRTSYRPNLNYRRLDTLVERLEVENFRVIEHTAWHQYAHSLNSSNKLLVQFGNFSTRQFREIEGTVSLTLGRYLHLDMNLWNIIEQPSTYDSSMHTFQTPIFYYKIQESRRLSLGEVHYFDHPRFSLLVQIRRVSIPNTMQDLFNQL